MACHDRIQAFLLQDEVTDVREGVTTERGTESLRTAAKLMNIGTAPTLEGDQILQDTEATIPANKLTIVTGPVSSGKSTILKLFLGEVAIAEGQIKVNVNNIGYAAQIPWLRSKSVRDNILGATPMVETWYQTVTEACGLNIDFGRWPEGDMTKAGQSGTNLSGGQRQRIVRRKAFICC